MSFYSPEPLRVVRVCRNCSGPKQPKEATLAKRRIVVADDNQPFLQKLVSLLADEFEIVATVNDGKSALKAIRDHNAEAAVLDLGLPLLNGIEVARELARYPQDPAIVVCSVETDPEVVQAARDAGASAYVFKLRVEKDLISAIKSALEGKTLISPSSA